MIEAMCISIREMQGAFLTPGPVSAGLPVHVCGRAIGNSTVTEPV